MVEFTPHKGNEIEQTDISLFEIELYFLFFLSFFEFFSPLPFIERISVYRESLYRSS